MLGFSRGRRERALRLVRLGGATRSLLAALPLLLTATAALAASNTLVVQNLCADTIWVQQQNMNPAGGGVANPEVVALAPKASHTYAISTKVPSPSVTLWPKTQCNAEGQACQTGQWAAPCPTTGCSFAIASMAEFTFMPGASGQSYMDVTIVNGFSIPIAVVPSKNNDSTKNCTPAVCPTLGQGNCPTAENLSSNGAFPTYAKVNLQRFATGKVFEGCISPCGYLTKVLGFAPTSAEAEQYCCAGPTYGQPAKCKAGPMPKTQYVANIHKACSDEAYAWQYDDVNGTHSCIGSVAMAVTFCPPAKP